MKLGIYYLRFRILFFSSSFYHAQCKIRAAGDAEPAEVALDGLHRARVALVISNKHLVRAQLHADAAALAPLVKNIERDFRIFALLFFLSIFDFSLL
jgi:hypothetical protein